MQVALRASWLCVAGLLAAFVSLTLVPTEVAHAQAPDVRNVRPTVMLMVDTSGSMERKGKCTCTTASCDECLPMCSAASEKSRWNVLLEALTGTWDAFSCTKDNRLSDAAAYDYRYFIPHHAPPVGTSQASNGLLDAYLERIRFGLMTFDNVPSLTTVNRLVPSTAWTAAVESASRGVRGMYSYGDNREFLFPGCSQPFMMNNGARSDSPGGDVEPGNLISVGSDISDYRAMNAVIQTSLLGTRPYGATPIAAMLEDFEYYLQNHADVKQPDGSGSGDPYFSCRSRYGILITDGEPNADMRGAPYYCEAYPSGDACPYEESHLTSRTLCGVGGTGECEGLVDGLVVVGIDVDDPDAQATLNRIAEEGGSVGLTVADPTDPSPTPAIFVDGDDPSALRAVLSDVLDRLASGTTTRGIPAFSSNSAGGAQSQFNGGFRIPDLATDSWSGVLERKRFECSGVTPVEQPITDDDRFQEVLNSRTLPRELYTVLPDVANSTGHVTGTGRNDVPASLVPPTGSFDQPVQTGLSAVSFALSNASLTRDHLGVSTSAERDEVISWVHADSSSSRADHRLGDIYHSSPVVVTAPQADIADESFNLFRRRADVADRPPVVYVGTNDGILHAFVAADHEATVGGVTVNYNAGDELWGFIPPALLPRLKDAMVSHQAMVDAIPVVKDVFYTRLPGDGATADEYRTVIIVGLRGGGNAYVALDVTDPTQGPKFLWQFTHADMGKTYAMPAMAQVLVDIGGDLHQRGVAILPGGVADPTDGATQRLPDGSWSTPAGCAPDGAGMPPMADGTDRVRTAIRCYGPSAARQLFIVDVATGMTLQHIDESVFNAPMAGGVSVFTGAVGAMVTRAFMSDQEGVLWRLDMASTDPTNWTAAPFYDLFWAGDETDSQPSFFPPVLTVDEEGAVVVLQASGDIDLLDAPFVNHVASLTERITFDATGAASSVEAEVNWRKELEEGEQATGPLDLFDGVVYFGTFKSETDPVDACEAGYSRIWGVHYKNRVDDISYAPEPALESTVGSGVFDATFIGPYDNQIVMGVAVTRRPRCFEGQNVSDPYFGNHYQVTDSGGGDFQLVAQVGGSSSPSSDLGEVRRSLPAPDTFTQVQAYASDVD